MTQMRKKIQKQAENKLHTVYVSTEQSLQPRDVILNHPNHKSFQQTSNRAIHKQDKQGCDQIFRTEGTKGKMQVIENTQISTLLTHADQW